MNLYKNNIWVSFNYGSHSLVYSKYITLPFVPFLGFSIIVNDEKEYEIELVNNEYCHTTIKWNIEKEQFEINIRNVWKFPVSDETIDYILEEFSDWERHDQTDIESLKNLMKKRQS